MKLGFIGCGNMAKAIISGVVKSQIIPKEEIIASDALQVAIDKAQADIGINVTLNNKEVAKNSEILFLAVKPHFYETVIKEISQFINEKTIVVTIAPGKTLNFLSQTFGKEVKIVRTMPNTPAMVGEGMTAVCHNDLVEPNELEKVLEILNAVGKSAVVLESMMDAVVAVSGSSPAYVYMFIEALADGAVMQGMPRNLAYEFASQAVLGSAKMVLETGMHPGALKDMVCSPGGTTIDAVAKLEETGMRSSVIEAMKVCAEKSKRM